MKKCAYCGQETPDDATVCSLDGNPLVVVNNDSEGDHKSPEEHRRATVFKASIVAGVIFLYVAFRILTTGQGQVFIKSITISGAILGCLFAVMSVRFFAQRSSSAWNWVFVAIFTILSYWLFANVFILLLGVVFGWLDKLV